MSHNSQLNIKSLLGLFTILIFSLTNVSADVNFDYDRQADLGVFRPSTGNWHSFSTESESFLTTQWGLSTDVLVPADYDGDGKTDIAVYRGGTWFIYESSTLRLKVFYYGAATDFPLNSINVRQSIVAIP